MQEYHESRSRSAVDESGDPTSWMFGANEFSSGQVVARVRSPARTSGLAESRTSNYPPDTRRKHYRSTRQQQRDLQQQYNSNNYDYTSHATANPLEVRHGPQHRLMGSMPRMPASEPVYMDVDPSLHQSAMALKQLQQEASAFGPPRSAAFIETYSTPTTANTTRSSSSRTPPPSSTRFGNLNQLNCSSNDNEESFDPTVGYSPSRSTPSPSNLHKGLQNTSTSSSAGRTSTSPRQPYVSPYISPVAKVYRVPGGMFHNQPNPRIASPAANRSTQSSLYDERPVRQPEKHHGDQLIMFGDDYDLGSINTGMSQQELLQKRRDVKKRRDEKNKYGKKKKGKERIVNMPPRLLGMGGWDTSPITKLTSKDNSQHTPYEDRKEELKKWNVARSFGPPDEGSTDASTRESGEDGAPRAHDGQHKLQPQNPWVPNHSDSVSLSSFPLLSTNAKGGLNTSEPPPTDAPVLYTQPGNIPQLQLDHLYQRLYVEQQQGVPRAQEQQQLYHAQNQNQLPQQEPRPYHTVIYNRQHGEELKQLESHLQYLQAQHEQLEQEIQERGMDPEADPKDESHDSRPRAVHFAPKLAQAIEYQHELASGDSKESPTSVTDYGGGRQDYSSSTTSGVTPKNLFPEKLVSILRRKSSTALDSTGRYPGATRGRTNVPMFKDIHGRELSPIRSLRGAHHIQPSIYQVESHEYFSSLPENLNEKDVAVLFDSDPDADLELTRRDVSFDQDAELLSDAFIEAVASIVLQTAIRRFLAIRMAKRLRTASRHQPPNTSPSCSEPNQSRNRAPQAEVSALTIDQEQSTRTDPMAQEDFFYDLAAIQIQSVFRGWWVRDSINVDQYCSTLIQKIFRGFRARVEYDYEIYRIIVVQGMWRRNIALRKTTHVFSLIIKIQALCRGALVRKTVSARSELTPSPSPSAKGAHGSEKHSHIRTSYDRAKTRKKAALHARSLCPPALEVARICAIIIQTHWRSYVGRICFLQSLDDVVVVQSVARRWLTCRRLAPARASHRRNSRKQHMKPRHSQTEVVRSSAQFAKLESLNSSRLSAASVAKSQASVPFRNMSDEDVEQTPIRVQPYLQPYHDVERERQTVQQHDGHGHFDDPSRFGGSRNVWDRSGAAKEVVLSQTNSYRHGNPRSESSSSYEPAITAARQYGSQGSSLVNHRTISSEQYARSKGWNAQEEIDKEGTRKLMNQWKQKDMVNSWKIEKPKPGR